MQEQLAERAGLTVKGISGMERGERRQLLNMAIKRALRHCLIWKAYCHFCLFQVK
jgi:DNA-binding XRE family transcriptional regulator